MSEQECNISIDETADIHPSVLLEGNITIGQFVRIGHGTVIVGDVTVGDHTRIACNVVLRGRNTIGSYVQIYDNACIEGGRGSGVGTAEERDRSIIADGAWINHGATMHGCQIAEGAIIGLNVALDYNTRVGKGAIVTNGSACPVDTVIPDNCIAVGVPAKIVKRNITDEDRIRVMGLLPSARVRHFGERQEQAALQKKGL